MKHNLDGMWQNSFDSIMHAIDHYVELESDNAKEWHHHKWIIISVHHSASCIAYTLLKELVPEHTLLKKGKTCFPHLEQSVKALKKAKCLTNSETLLVNVMCRLNDLRNQILHRLPPDKLSKDCISYAALSLVGILRVYCNRAEKSFYQLFDQYPECRNLFLKVISSKHIDEYRNLMEGLLCDVHPISALEVCPECGALAVVENHCEVCFEDLSGLTCRHCMCEFVVLSNPISNHWCPNCGMDC